MKMKWMLLGLLISGTTAHAVVTVENAVAAQTPGTKNVTIGYDVSSDFAGAVTITLKAFDGDHEVVLTSLTGDVGTGVSTGTGKTVIWNAGADWGGQHTAGLKFLVLADDGKDITPIPVAGTVVVPAGSTTGTDPDFGALNLTMTDNLYMDETEVSKAVWDQVYDWAVTNGFDFNNPGLAVTNNHPVTTVNWYDCVKWCNARSELEGLEPCYTVGGATYKSGNQVPDVDVGNTGYRLPTSEEWEYAARGGAASRFAWGSQITHDEANYFSSAAFSYDTSATRGFHPDYDSGWPGTSPVGSFVPNGYGLYDVSGNVAEWCWDEDVLDGSRNMHDGSWIDGAEFLRCGSVFLQFPDSATVYDGFRTVRDAGVSVSGSTVTLVDARDYTLSVTSLVGAPAPAAGTHTYAWGTTVTCAVDQVVTIAGAIFHNQGWTGSGSVPASGSTSSAGEIALTDVDSSILWKWIADNDEDLLPNEWELVYFGAVTGAVADADLDGDGYSNGAEYWLGTDPTNGMSHLDFTIGSSNGVPVLSCATRLGRIYRIEYTDSLKEPVWKVLTTFGGTGARESRSDASARPGRYYRMFVEMAAGIEPSVAWPWLTDDDGDLLPNVWELAYFGSAIGADAGVDTDADGYTNGDEFLLGTDPTNATSQLNFMFDGTGLSFSTVAGRTYRVEYSESLTEPDWLLLTNVVGSGSSEQIVDPAEGILRYYRVVVAIYDPSLSLAWQWLAVAGGTDLDGDLLPNDWELAYFGSKTAAIYAEDADDDGYSNGKEFLLGSNPTNALSHLHFAVVQSNAVPVVSCASVAGRIYRVEYAESLVAPAWLPLTSSAGTGATLWFPDATASSNRYYRMQVDHL